VIDAGAAVPVDARVWNAPGTEPVTLGDVLAGESLALLCFYPFDWSST
jgi:hypothetical protein